MQSNKFKLPYSFLSIVFILGFFSHFFIVWYYSVDIPYWDEWLVLTKSHSLLEQSFWSFVTEPLWDSRITWTYALIWLSTRIDGWNQIHLTLINYLFFGWILLWIARFMRRNFKQHNPTPWLLSLILLLTPWYWEAHGWSQQNHTHITVFLSLVVIDILFRKEHSFLTVLFASLLCTINILAWGRGLASVLTITTMWTVYTYSRWRLKPSSLLKWLFYIIPVIVSIGMYTGLFILDPLFKGSQNFTPPWSMSFIKYFLSLISMTYGIDFVSYSLGLLTLMITIFPVLTSLIGVRGRLYNLSDLEWKLITIISVWLGAALAISLARSSLPLDTAKSSRYAFSFGFLLPFIVMYYNYHFSRAYKTVRYIPSAVLLFSTIFFIQSSTNSRYEDFYFHRKMSGVECIKSAREGQMLRCPLVSFLPDLRSSVLMSEKLELSFYKKIKDNHSLNSRVYQNYQLPYRF